MGKHTEKLSKGGGVLYGMVFQLGLSDSLLAGRKAGLPLVGGKTEP
jgi:hypothetical protein